MKKIYNKVDTTLPVYLWTDDVEVSTEQIEHISVVSHFIIAIMRMHGFRLSHRRSNGYDG